MENIISVQQLVDKGRFKELLIKKITFLRKQRDPKTSYKRSPYDCFIGDFSREPIGLTADRILRRYKEVLDFESNLSSAKRKYIKALGDLVLREYVDELNKEKENEKKETPA